MLTMVEMNVHIPLDFDKEEADRLKAREKDAVSGTAACRQMATHLARRRPLRERQHLRRRKQFRASRHPD